MSKIVNVVIAGLGGQGVLKASDILAHAAFIAGFDVKKSELHGMSQRGGSVSSDIRYGENILSPMIPRGEADCLIVLSHDQVDRNLYMKKDSGVLITPDNVEERQLPNKRCLNIALLGVFSMRFKDIPEEALLTAIKAAFPEKIAELNEEALKTGRGGN